ncbi:beta-eliminating lyase-related protein [Nonomuraea sp. bgisy101]|uniref:beta-eliminating lyase-related protein n=1 Tax=Nonomuraea sp. bgisy101 TaxID=3413784 RepID=UPI003D74B967
MTVRSAAQVVEPMRGDPRTDPDAVNLSPDTQARPTDTMRETVARPTAGDAQTRADPTILALEERIADLREHQTAPLPPDARTHTEPTTQALEERDADLHEHQAAPLPPAGIMRDEVAVRSHVGYRHDEILAEASTHLINAEATVVVPGGAPLLTSGPRAWSP